MVGIAKENLMPAKFSEYCFGNASKVQVHVSTRSIIHSIAVQPRTDVYMDSVTAELALSLAEPIFS